MPPIEIGIIRVHSDTFHTKTSMNRGKRTRKRGQTRETSGWGSKRKKASHRDTKDKQNHGYVHSFNKQKQKTEVGKVRVDLDARMLEPATR